MGHQLQVRNYVPHSKLYLSDQVETPTNISYSTPEPEQSESEKVIQRMREKLRKDLMEKNKLDTEKIKTLITSKELLPSCKILPK